MRDRNVHHTSGVYHNLVCTLTLPSTAFSLPSTEGVRRIGIVRYCLFAAIIPLANHGIIDDSIGYRVVVRIGSRVSRKPTGGKGEGMLRQL